ncbi:D-methionine transport system ATP-binding protein [Paenibacillus sp. UNC496MF]|uniref:methionine ABC transporter ATP-binding protein n=1 Tax=Paenibacillus sp. UNC496MF TaxID=1502753 RepID=UPI0008E45FA1|nr:methionine ABC transporter ATP-binding protein [Paenibacillus sp. UNC496MF]SFJ34723.1 D-methionine transport system ATP-binding protein [Paenibacillus sp. UNC496MF]
MITLNKISKTFATAGGPLHAVSSASLTVEQGDIYGLIGFSGAGKSTLLRTINLLERPDEGTVHVDGEELTALPLRELRKRRLAIGMIFQHFNLLNNRNVYDNVSFPLEIAKVPRAERRQRIESCLEMVGLSDKAKAYPAKLSGGQKQRVAIARALAGNPKILLCDEPTSSVDPQTTGSILAALQEINRNLGITIVIVTHEMNVVKAICNKVAVMEHGRIVEKFDLREKHIVPQSPIAQYLFKNEIALERELEASYA